MRATIQASVDEREALRYLGHKGQELGDDLAATFQRIAEKVGELQPIGDAKAFAIEGVDERGVRLAGTSLFLPGTHIARHLSGAEEAMLIAVTLGFESERLLKKFACVSATEGLIADACASSLVERAASAFDEDVHAAAAELGMRCGKRFSPGYGDFPLSVQRDFLAAIGAQKSLGISVTDGDLMVPAKSITAVIPVFCEGVADAHASDVLDRIFERR